MFNLTKKKTSKAIDEIVNSKTISALVRYKPFKDFIKYNKDPLVLSMVDSYNILDSKEKALRLEIKNMEKEKKKLTPRVLHFSNKINETHKMIYENQLDEIQKRLLELKEKTDVNREEVTDLVRKKEDLNIELLRVTLDICYETILKDEKRLTPLLKEIEDMRASLEKKRIERDNLQKRIETTYNFIHGVMGAKDTQEIDENMF